MNRQEARLLSAEERKAKYEKLVHEIREKLANPDADYRLKRDLNLAKRGLYAAQAQLRESRFDGLSAWEIGTCP